MSAAKPPENSAGDGAAIAQGVVVVTKDAIYERRVDQALWFLNNLQTPLTLKELENPQYEVVDIISSIGSSSNGASGAAGMAGGNSRHQHPHSHSHHWSSPHRLDRQQGSLFSVQDMSLLTESLDRKYKFTEDTVFWTISREYNVVFVLDISQSMYSLDPNTNSSHVEVALETIEKCVMGMAQPFTVRSTLGLPDYEVVEPHICASVVGYCPRPPGRYPSEKDGKRLPFCRTLTHAYMVNTENVSEFIKVIRNFLYNYEIEVLDSLSSFPPPPPPIQPEHLFGPERSNSGKAQGAKGTRPGGRSREHTPFESASSSNKKPSAGDTFTFTYDPEAPLLHTLQIVDYFLRVMPEVCAPVFIYLTDGVMRSNFSVSKIQSVTSSLCRRNTQCTLIQVGSCGGFTPETTLGFVGDNEQLLYLAASLGGSFIYASDCPSAVLPNTANFYHQVMLIRESRLARTPVRYRYDLTQYGARRLGDMPRERLSTKTDISQQLSLSGDCEFPWSADSKPPVVDTVTARYNDYNIPVSLNLLIEARINEGFVIKSMSVSRFDRDGIAERVNIKMELVWHPNIVVVYRITNTHYISQADNPAQSQLPLVSGTKSAPESVASDNYSQLVEDRGQRNPNMVDIVIRSYNMFTLVFLRTTQNDGRKGDIFAKAKMLHSFLTAIMDKDEKMRQMYTLPSSSLSSRPRGQPPVFDPPSPPAIPNVHRFAGEAVPLATRVITDEVDLSVFMSYTDWSQQHYHLYDIMRQYSKSGSGGSTHTASLSSFNYTTSIFIDSDLILSYVDGMDFTGTAAQGRRILNDFRAHVCSAGTWALLKDEGTSVVFLQDSFRLSVMTPVFIVAHWEMATSWVLRVSFSVYNGSVDTRKVVMDCLPTFAESFKPAYCDPNRDTVVRAARPLHLLPMDVDLTERAPPGLLSTRDIGDMHTYVVDWRWTYLAREGTREDLSGEGSDKEIVRQALHRLALTLGLTRLVQDFTLINAKGESTGLLDGPGASDYDSCVTYYQEREGHDGEALLLACQYQVIVDLKQSSVTARTWLEPWSPRFLRTLFENDFRLLAPLGTFQQILQPERCFQLKVPNIAEFHSKRMNMFSIMSVVNSSRIALRMLQLPDILPADAVWNQPDGADTITLDDPTYEYTPEPDPDEDLEIRELDENGNITNTIKATEYYKTHDRDETVKLVGQKKLKIVHVGTNAMQRYAILLERFMLTLFDKDNNGKYDPHIQKYRYNEYNPFILALINPGHPRKLFFSKLSADWLTTGEFTIVAYRCFLEYALFRHCDAISVNAERFNKLMFSSNIIKELSEFCQGVHQATGVPNALDEHLYMDKWYVIRLPNNTSFLMVLLPNVPLSAPSRPRATHAAPQEEPAGGASASQESARPGSSVAQGYGEHKPRSRAASAKHTRAGSEPASPPVLTALNAYTLVMECSMDNSEMRRHVRAMEARSQAATKTKLNLKPLNVNCKDTRVQGQTLQGFVGQKDVPTPFTEYALAEINKLERMYSEAYLQTIYLALLLRRAVSPADLLASQQSTLWQKRSIDVDITAFLHSQDAARLSRDKEWQEQDGQNLQRKFNELIRQSFTPLPHDVDPSQGKYYYCKSTPDKRSELEICLQLAQNPLFINFQCSVEVVDGERTHKKRLNMPISELPLSLERLCEHAGISWRPPTDHFEPSMDVRVILHINCLYLPDESLVKGSEKSDAPELAESASAEPVKILLSKPDKQELESRWTRLFQKTMSLSSLVPGTLDPASAKESGAARAAAAGASGDVLSPAVIAKERIDAQLATLEGLPHDQLELVRHCHGKFLRFIAQETLYALRDIKPVTVPLLNQVWHTIATTVDEEVPSDVLEFSHHKVDLKFLISTPDEAKRRHAMDLVMRELLKQDNSSSSYPIGRLHELGGIVYMRDIRSRSDRMKARARMRARAQSDPSRDSDHGPQKIAAVDLSDVIPSWFLIKPTAALDGVRILTHNYSVVTGETADNVLAATRQLLMVALRAANTRLLLEEMAETHAFPDLLVLPDAARANVPAGAGAMRMSHNLDAHAGRDEMLSASQVGSQVALPNLSALAHPAAEQSVARDPHKPSALAGPARIRAGLEAPAASSGNAFNIASILKPYIPDNPDFYACEEQFTSVFPLHPRISPSKAIQAVLASGMMNNRLANQRSMFFVRDGGSIFYALLTVDRRPYTTPFGPSSGNAARAAESAPNGSTVASGVVSPIFTTDLVMPGAHTVATTSPDPAAYPTFTGTPQASLDHAISQHAVGSRTGTPRSPPGSSSGLTAGAQGSLFARKRSPLVPAVNVALQGSLSTAAAQSSGQESYPGSPRRTIGDSIFRAGARQAIPEARNRQSLPGTPESPTSRYLVSSLNNLEGEHMRSSAAGSHGAQPGDAHNSRHNAIAGRGGHTADPEGMAARSNIASAAGDSHLHQQHRLPHATSVVSMPSFDYWSSSDLAHAIHPEEKTVPCLVLHIYGVDKPRKEMTRSLVRQIRERITVHVTMPEMSDMLYRRVALNDHDMDFLFPKCNPEPTILYLPLPQFVHNLGRLVLHFRQALGDIIPPFPSSDLLLKALRRSYRHLQTRHEKEDDSDGTTIGNQVPDALRDDLSRVLEGWECGGESHQRLPVEKLVFLYNFFTKSAPPPPEMSDIGTGIAIVSALPLNKDRVVSRDMWEAASSPASASLGLPGMHGQSTVAGTDSNAAAGAPTSRRISRSSAHRRATSYLSLDTAGAGAGAGAPCEYQGLSTDLQSSPISPELLAQRMLQRRASHTPSPLAHSQSASSATTSGRSSPITESSSLSNASDENAGRVPVPLPLSQLTGLFNEYLRQFEQARSHLRLAASEFGDLPGIMERQVEEFKGDPVLVVTLWSNASVRLDRLAAYVSRVYWNSLGDYVSEHILYPVLASSWGSNPKSVVSLPDPTVAPDSAASSSSGSKYDGEHPREVIAQVQHSSIESGRSVSQPYPELLYTRDVHLPKAPSKFTEGSKRQVHAMEVARQMAQYWGRQQTVKSIQHSRQRLPRVTAISHWFSEELRGVLETMCPAMKPTLFRLLENPLILNDPEQSVGATPTSLFPAFTLRKAKQHDQSSVVYDISGLPRALKGTRQSFCIMCTLPLGDASAHGRSGPASATNTVRHGRLASASRPQREHALQRPLPRSTAGGSTPAHAQGHMQGLGLQGWGQQHQQHLHQPHQPQLHHPRPGQKRQYGKGDVVVPGRRSNMPVISERYPAPSAAKKMPAPSEYKPIADPEPPVMDADDVVYYMPRDKATQVSTISWLVVWLVGGELEMVGYNVSQRLWDAICDQIKQRLDRERRRKQLLGMFASHMCGIFPGYDKKALYRSIASTWLDRNVTRDLINKFALQTQLACDDQIHYFNLERYMSPDYRHMVGLEEGSSQLAELVANPPVADMTLNDMKMELALRQLQPEHLRWARKLTYVDYTQPYVDTHHPDTLFRIGSRFMRAYQGRISQVIRYDELMRIAERWRRMASVNGLCDSANQSSRMLLLGSQTSDAYGSSLDGHRTAPRHHSRQQPAASQPEHANGEKAKSNRDPERTSASLQAEGDGRASFKARANDPPAEGHTEKDVSLDDIKTIMENARLLHFVCAPLPVTSSLKPDSLDLRGFRRLFRTISAFLQNLADSYIDYLYSTGYTVAKRSERIEPWKDALAALGYSQEQISRYTRVAMADAEVLARGKHADSAVATALPGIQVPSAYLFANTERSRLVTDIEVCPTMLSIRMHALSRFSSEWRSAVPGYVRSSINPRSIKKFTYELSKFKKLLHAKSFVYDFQLRYVACLLRPLESAPYVADMAVSKSATDPALLSVEAGIFSSESESEPTSSESDTTESSDSDTDEFARLIRQMGIGNRKERARFKRDIKQTVAHALHVHIDLMAFFKTLSEQRYFSTRFSSRRLVRAKFPIQHRDLYEYFLDHSERYHFYTSGCRPLASRHSASGLDGDQLGADRDTGTTTHSGCYRLYEGVLSELVHSQYGGVLDNPGLAGVQDGSRGWPQSALGRSPQYKPDSVGLGSRPVSSHFSQGQSQGGGINIASSAPEPAWKSVHMRNRSSETPQGPGHHPIASNRKDRDPCLLGAPGAGTSAGPLQASQAGSNYGAAASGRTQLAASYAVGSQWINSMAGSSGRRHNKYHGGGQRGIGEPQSHLSVQFSGQPTVPPPTPSPLDLHGSAGGPAGNPDGCDRQSSSSTAEKASIAAKSLDFTLNEYSACKIHLSSTDAFVRVSLMALAPECECCKAKTSIAAQQRKERRRGNVLSHAAIDEEDKKHRRRRHHHHRRHKHDHKLSEHGDTHNRPRSHHRRSGEDARRGAELGDAHGAGDNAATPPATNINSTRSDGASAADANRHGRCYTGSCNHEHQTPLQRWMSSLANSRIADLQVETTQAQNYAPDGHLGGFSDAMRAVDKGDTAQLSYYLIIDMDPQTTISLSNLKEDEGRSRNGSLCPLAGQPDNAENEARADPSIYGGRQCSRCSELSMRDSRQRMCGIHKALSVVQVDMRDWENRGYVWANEPTMVMEVSAIDPDEYEKEDPDVLAWIQKTVHRMVRHTFVDYHRDLNWYRMYQHVRMADLPGNLEPAGIRDLVEFIEAQSWIDVGASDEAVQQLLDLNLPAHRIIQSLQLRLRRLYFEPTLVMTSLQASNANSTPPTAIPQHVLAADEPRHGSSRRYQATGLSKAAASSTSLNATPPATPASEAPFSLSRHSTIEPPAQAVPASGSRVRSDSTVAAGQEMQSNMTRHVLPSSPLCPTAAIDSHGRILRDQSSSNIDDVLRLLSPLNTRPSRKTLLDPAFQKILGRHIRLNMVDSPWLCTKHTHVITAPMFNWSLEEPTPPASDASAGDPRDGGTASSSAAAAATVLAAAPTSRRAMQTHESSGTPASTLSQGRYGHRGRAGVSIASFGTGSVHGSGLHPSHAASAVTPEPAVTHFHATHGRADSRKASVAVPDPSASGTSLSNMTSASRFGNPCVEAMPGSLLIVDPNDDQFAARLLVLNPFAYHSVLELMFVRSADGENVQLRHIRAVARSRHRDGLYEYERKHVNLALSTISAVAWDVMTQP
ncbi:hypothetical protein GQ54DRAFT_326270 [Martensiomyces pterosporus]|nr:hypothetical protein GQ54DRAFT_326270 [Martensiomyces pterosporus]